MIALDHALACLTREDPSLNVIHNEETGQVCTSYCTLVQFESPDCYQNNKPLQLCGSIN